MDYLYIQGVPVLHSISRNFHFRTAEFIMNKAKASEEEVKSGVDRIMTIYRARGLEVAQVNADNDFECIEDIIRPARLYTVGANEHVGDVERSIRTVKDCTRCHIHRLPYKHYPKIMVAGMITHVMKSLNQLPSETGIDNHLSPAALITGSTKPDYNSLIKLNYGEYVQAYEPNTTTNDQSPMSVGAIALYPKNANSWYFMSLQSGKRIHRHGWTVLPISKEVIERVNLLGKKQKQRAVIGNFSYTWLPSNDLNGSDITSSENDQEDVIEVEEDVMTQNNDVTPVIVRDLEEWQPTYVGESEYYSSVSGRNKNMNNNNSTVVRVHGQQDDVLSVPVYDQPTRTNQVQEENVTIEATSASGDNNVEATHDNRGSYPEKEPEPEDTVRVYETSSYDTDSSNDEPTTHKHKDKKKVSKNNNGIISDSDLSVGTDTSGYESSENEIENENEAERSNNKELTKQTSQDVAGDTTSVNSDEEAMAAGHIDDADSIPTTGAGRIIKKINYKNLIKYGSQSYQNNDTNDMGVSNKWKKDDMFKRMNGIIMMHLTKSNEFEQPGVSPLRGTVTKH